MSFFAYLLKNEDDESRIASIAFEKATKLEPASKAEAEALGACNKSFARSNHQKSETIVWKIKKPSASVSKNLESKVPHLVFLILIVIVVVVWVLMSN